MSKVIYYIRREAVRCDSHLYRKIDNKLEIFYEYTGWASVKESDLKVVRLDTYLKHCDGSSNADYDNEILSHFKSEFYKDILSD